MSTLTSQSTLSSDDERLIEVTLMVGYGYLPERNVFDEVEWVRDRRGQPSNPINEGQP